MWKVCLVLLYMSCGRVMTSVRQRAKSDYQYSSLCCLCNAFKTRQVTFKFAYTRQTEKAWRHADSSESGRGPNRQGPGRQRKTLNYQVCETIWWKCDGDGLENTLWGWSASGNRCAGKVRWWGRGQVTGRGGVTAGQEEQVGYGHVWHRQRAEKWMWLTLCQW